jgi:cysteine desulfurase / selenocysteine lyase
VADSPLLHQHVRAKPLVYLDSAATTQKPQVMIDRVTRFYADENANVHRGVHRLRERERRRVVHIAVTDHPTAAWTAQ